MIPSVVPYLVSFSDDPSNQFRMGLHIFSDQKESGFDMAGLQHIEQPWSVFRAWTIVERHG